jgi:hypothetical protein
MLVTIVPVQESGNDLQHLEFLRVRSIHAEETEEVVGDDLSEDYVRWILPTMSAPEVLTD